MFADFVTFGNYLQSFTGTGNLAQNSQFANSQFAREALTWSLLDIDNDTNAALIITEYVIDNADFNLTGAAGNQYATSNLRAWLNSTGGTDRGTVANNNQTADGFLNTAFTTAERSRILSTTTTAADDGPARVWLGNNLGTPGTFNNGWNVAWQATPPAIVNGDFVFALSNTEVWQHFGVTRRGADYFAAGENPSFFPNAAAQVSDYAFSKGIARYSGIARGWVGYGDWWGRTAGHTSNLATEINHDGQLRVSSPVNTIHIGVRPAIWVEVVDPSIV